MKHLAHGGVAVNIGVATFDVGVFGSIGNGNGTVGLHELSLSFADAVTLGSVFNVGLSGAFKSRFHQHALDDVLNLFYGWDAGFDFFIGDANDFISNVFGAIWAEFFSSSTSLGDGVYDFFFFERYNFAVSLPNRFEHLLLPP